MLLPAYATDGVTYVLRAKASCTVVGTGMNACGDPLRTGTPSWVAETGIPTFYHPVQTSDPASGLWVRPHRFDDRLIRHGSQTYKGWSFEGWSFDDRLIRHGSQTYSRCSDCSCGFGNWLIRHGYQTHVHADEAVLQLENRLIRHGCQTGRAVYCPVGLFDERTVCRENR